VSTILSVVPLADGQGGLVNRRLVGRNQRGEDVLTIDEERLVPGRR
jgi:acyl dehydratase